MRSSVNVVLVIGTALILVAAALYHIAEHRQDRPDSATATYQQPVAPT
jgi:hypothetical protein